MQDSYSSLSYSRRLRQLGRITCAALFLAVCSSGGGDGGGGTSHTQPTQTWTLGAPIYYPTFNNEVGQTAVGDLNGDGRNDVAICNGQVLIYYQDLTGAFSSMTALDPDQHFDLETKRISLGDLNNDGKLDIVLTGRCISASCQSLGKFIVLYQNPQTGQLVPGPLQNISGNLAIHAAIGDINSDGLADLVIVSQAGLLSIFYQNSTGGLGPETIYDKTTIMVTAQVRISDMDNDGDNDIVIQSQPKQLAFIKQDSTVTPGVLSDTPDLYSVETTYWPQIYTFEVGDLNGDGKNDVAAPDPGNNGYLNIFLQNNSGTLDPPILVTVFTSPLYGIEIVDVDGDGLNDIAGDVVNLASGNVYVFHQKADHSFGSPVAYTFPTISGGGSQEYDALSFGDITGDGRPDAVVTWWPDKLLVVLPGVTS